MRFFILLILFFPVSHSMAIGADECFLQGVSGGRSLTLKNIDVTPPSYGLNNSKLYGYCEMDSGYEFLQCTDAKGKKPIVAYKLDTENLEKQTYNCTSGCSAEVVNKFVMICEGD
jgi:hypothetical protein